MRHDACRHLVLHDELTDEARAHLDGCPPCREYAERIGCVVGTAPSLLSGRVPADLADRVVARVRAEAGIPVPPAPLAITAVEGPAKAATPADISHARSRRSRRAALVRSGAVAAAVALVVAALAVLPGRGWDGTNLSDVLLAAAERTAAAGTARLRIDGSASMTVRLPALALPPVEEIPVPGAPDLFDLPNFPEPPDAGGYSGFEEFAESLRESQRRVEESLRRSQQEALQAQQEARRRVGEAQQEIRRRLAALPRQHAVTVAFEGNGEMIEPDRLHLAGTTRLVRSTPPVPGAASAPFEIIVADGSSYTLQPDGTWVRAPGPVGPFGVLSLDAAALLDMLKVPRTGLSDLGVEQLDGVRVRHVRYDIADVGLAPRPLGSRVTYTVEGWIGVDDNLLRKLTLRSSGRPAPREDAATAEWQTEMTVRLFDFGAPLSIEAPSPEVVRDRFTGPIGPLAVVHPFHTGLTFSFSIALPFLDDWSRHGR